MSESKSVTLYPSDARALANAIAERLKREGEDLGHLPTPSITHLIAVVVERYFDL